MVNFKATGDKKEYNIRLPRRGEKQIPNKRNTLLQDVKHRDFTIKCLYLPVDFKNINKDVVDLIEGTLDIKNKLIKFVGCPTERIIESPVRILRAISLCAQTNYKIPKASIKAIEKNTQLLMTVDTDSIRKELSKIILSKAPSKAFKLMDKLGVLKVIMPELHECSKVKQATKYHKYDVLDHCLSAMDKTDEDIVLRLAALLHDVGKAQTMKIINGKVTFHSHEVISAALAENILKRLNFPANIVQEVVWLVRLHMFHYTDDWGNSAVRRFIKKAKIDESNINNLDNHPLFKIRRADRLGKGIQMSEEEVVTIGQKELQERIRTVFFKNKNQNY